LRNLNEREKALEAEYRNKEEAAFRLTIRRNRQFGLWAAARLGVTGDAAETYADAVVAADFEAPGDEDIIAKVRADFAEKGLAASEADLRAALNRAGAEARL
jgi:hypothetical protein